MAKEPMQAIKIFFSYAHKDQKLRDELNTHLVTLKRSGFIETWYDRAIQAGTQWADEIDVHLNTADIVLLLISHHFFASDYCYGKEMKQALERYERGEARVIPIILSPVLWEETPIGKLQALPLDGKPITEARSRNAAFLKVVQGIRDVVKTLRSQRETAHPAVQKQHHSTIDTYEAIKLFQELLQPHTERQLRILYLVGEANMGKSHLLKHVFPLLARQDHQAQCIFFDLRNPVHAVPDILNMAYEQLGENNCSNYSKALQEMKVHSKSEANVTSVLTNFASFNTSTTLLNDPSRRDDRLTTQLILDLDRLKSNPLVLFFDTVDNAPEQIQIWLIKNFLKQVAFLSHVRIVVASRTLPEVPAAYMDLLQLHELLAVHDEEEYITYCQSLNKSLLEENIRALAKDFNYIPGLFANYVYRLAS